MYWTFNLAIRVNTLVRSSLQKKKKQSLAKIEHASAWSFSNPTARLMFCVNIYGEAPTY